MKHIFSNFASFSLPTAWLGVMVSYVGQVNWVTVIGFIVTIAASISTIRYQRAKNRREDAEALRRQQVHDAKQERDKKIHDLEVKRKEAEIAKMNRELRICDECQFYRTIKDE